MCYIWYCEVLLEMLCSPRSVFVIHLFLNVLVSLHSELMGVMKTANEVMAALHNHSWCYSPTSCFDVLQTFGESLLDPCCDWQARHKKYVQYQVAYGHHRNPVSHHQIWKFPCVPIFHIIFKSGMIDGPCQGSGQRY